MRHCVVISGPILKLKSELLGYLTFVFQFLWCEDWKLSYLDISRYCEALFPEAYQFSSYCLVV